MATFAKHFGLLGVKNGRDLPHYTGGFDRPKRTASIVWRDECGNVRIEHRYLAGQTLRPQLITLLLYEYVEGPRITEVETLVQGSLVAQGRQSQIVTEDNRLKQRAAVKDCEWSHSLKEDGRPRWVRSNR